MSWPVAIGIGASLLGSYLTSKNPKKVVQTTSRSSTPYRVKMPSGATVTMYAHGDPTTTQTTSGGSWLGDALSAGGSALTSYGLMSATGSGGLSSLGSNSMGVGGGTGSMNTQMKLTDWEKMKELIGGIG